MLIFRAISIEKIGTVDNAASFYSAVFNADVPHMRNLYLRDKQPVFVSKVELMEAIEQISNAKTSFVRLYLLQERPAETNDGLLFFSGFDESFKMFSSWIYREPDFMDGIPSVGPSEFKPSKIEGAAKIMNGVSTENRKSCNNFSIGKTHVDPLSGLRINIRGSVVGCEVAPEHSSGIRIELIDVLSGPFDL